MKHPESLALAVAFAVLAGGVGMAHSQHYGANVPSDLVILAQAKSPGGHDGHGTSAAKKSDAPSTKAFKAANNKMHAGMTIKFTGDADIDFIKGMIPHHEGAVEMARIVLEHGKDPEVRKLAEAIVKAQNEEIAFMRKWLESSKK